jgi:hypothetical protein
MKVLQGATKNRILSAGNLEQVRFLRPFVAVSNQPCRYEGKTTYLYLRIVEFLLAGSTFLYQNKDREVFYVSENGVEAIRPSWTSAKHNVVFVDGDNGFTEPQSFLDKRKAQFIIASSPRGAYQPWIKRASTTITISKLAIKPWSPCELFLTGLVLAFLLSTLD